MLTKNDLEKLAQLRLDDAVLLYEAGRYSSSYYLAGYAVELALKVCISKLIQPNTIPDKAFIEATYVHTPSALMSTAGLGPQFDADVTADSLLGAYWAIVNNWSEKSRYEFWDAVTTNTLLDAIGNPDHGVFQWVKKHW